MDKDLLISFSQQPSTEFPQIGNSPALTHFILIDPYFCIGKPNQICAPRVKDNTLISGSLGRGGQGSNPEVSSCIYSSWASQNSPTVLFVIGLDKDLFYSSNLYLCVDDGLLFREFYFVDLTPRNLHLGA